jgi:hypothetical protein
MKIKYKQYFWCVVTILASVRGVFVYHFGLTPNAVYTLTSVLLIFFGLLSFRLMLVNKGDKALVFLRNAILVNVLFIGYFMLVSMAFISLDQFSLAYSFAMFPIIFTLIRYDERALNGIVFIIALVTVIGVVYFYYMGIFGGFDAIQEAHSKLRVKFSYSRIGEHLLPAGYQGSHHDAANILVMCGVFFLSKAMLALGVLKKYICLALYFLVFWAALLSGSAANIIVLIGVSGLAMMFYAKKYPYVMALIVCCALFVLPLILDSLSNYTYFFEKVSSIQSGGKHESMLNALDFNNIFESFHAILLGFGHVLEVPLLHSEVAFVKWLVTVGLLPFLVSLFIWLSPLYYIHKFRKKSKAQARALRDHNPGISIVNFIKTLRAQQHRLIISAMPAFAGTMTLLHYGSLFRVTSVALFCVLLALFFKKYLEINSKRLLYYTYKQAGITP